MFYTHKASQTSFPHSGQSSTVGILSGFNQIPSYHLILSHKEGYKSTLSMNIKQIERISTSKKGTAITLVD